MNLKAFNALKERILKDRPEILDLHGLEINDEQLNEITELLLQPNSRVKHLNLSNNQITDVGVQTLADILPKMKTQVRRLDLSNNKITSIQGGQALDAVLLKTQMEFLNLEGNRLGVTDPALQMELRTLRLLNNPMGPSEVEAFAKALSNNPMLHALHFNQMARVDHEIENVVIVTQHMVSAGLRKQLLNSIETKLKQNRERRAKVEHSQSVGEPIILPSQIVDEKTLKEEEETTPIASDAVAPADVDAVAENEMNKRVQGVIEALRNGHDLKLQDEIKIIKELFQSSQFLIIDKNKDGQYCYDPGKNPDQTIRREQPYGEEGQPCYFSTFVTVTSKERARFKRLLNEHQGLVVNQPASDRSTLLCVCAELGKKEMARWLIEEQGANVNLTYNGKSPLLCAVQSVRPETVKYLLSKGADPIEEALILARSICKAYPYLEDAQECMKILEIVSKQREENRKAVEKIVANPSAIPRTLYAPYFAMPAIDKKTSADLESSSTAQPSAPEAPVDQAPEITQASAPVEPSIVRESAPPVDDAEPGSPEYEAILALPLPKGFLPKYGDVKQSITVTPSQQPITESASASAASTKKRLVSAPVTT